MLCSCRKYLYPPPPHGGDFSCDSLPHWKFQFSFILSFGTPPSSNFQSLKCGEHGYFLELHIQVGEAQARFLRDKIFWKNLLLIIAIKFQSKFTLTYSVVVQSMTSLIILGSAKKRKVVGYNLNKFSPACYLLVIFKH